MCITITYISKVQAVALYGVTGDVASTPETFYSVNTSDAIVISIKTLRNGDYGKSIAFNTKDGLMYNWSGFDNHIMETINLNDWTVTGITQTITAYDLHEVYVSTYDPVTRRFFTTDTDGNLAKVTTGGLFLTENHYSSVINIQIFYPR